MKNFPMLVVGLLLTAGCTSATNTHLHTWGRAQLTSLQIGKDVPLEVSPSQVIAFLECKHIEHSGYRVDPTKGRIITAVSRDRSKWHLIREDHVVDFRFDNSDHLIAKDGYNYLTGP